MIRILVLLAAAALAAPALAHTPAGTPNAQCEDGSLHEFAPAPVDPVRVESEYRWPLLDGAGENPACNGGAGDGHREFGAGAVRLAVNGGDGASGGSLACHGEAAHHGSTVHAALATGGALALYVGADASLYPPTSGPDCGDGVVLPCEDMPVKTNHPFPFNIVFDQVNAAILSVYDELGPHASLFAGCSWDDHVDDARGVGVATVTPGFGPGADGTYVVFVQENEAGIDVPAHVWT